MLCYACDLYCKLSHQFLMNYNKNYSTINIKNKKRMCTIICFAMNNYNIFENRLNTEKCIDFRVWEQVVKVKTNL